MRIRVLIADDSATSRLLLAGMLAVDPDMTVVGEACDGVEALELTKRLRPDIVTMDIRMPRMDGFEATKHIMVEAPTPIVIVSSSIDPADVASCMHALRAGALTVLARPFGPSAPLYEVERELFVTTLKSLAAVKVVRQRADPQHGHPLLKGRLGASLPRIVAIAASTGGPSALRSVLEELPATFSAPVLVVQHLAPGFLAGFAAWLNSHVSMHVKVAEHGEPLQPGTVYIGPEARHLGVSNTLRVQTTSQPPVEGFRPSASVLFESVARGYGSSALALVLTGMGRDGVEGLRHVRAQGGATLVQDAHTSVVFGMPSAAIEAGLADSILPLQAIAPRLKELVTQESTK